MTGGGFVYFIECAGRVKIGFSMDPTKRLTKVNADAPFPCTLLGVVPTTDFAEANLHGRFAKYRQHSEWFDLSPEISQFISNNCAGGHSGSDRFDRANLSDASAIKRWRYRAKACGKEIANKIGVNSATWSRWETGAVRIPAERVIEIERVTGIPRDLLRPDLYPAEQRAAS